MTPTLYLTRNGLLEPLGQSQVLAYLRGPRKDILDWLTSADPKIKGADEQKLKDAIADFAKTFA